MPVFFTGRYLVLGEPRLVRRTITDGDKIYTGLALGKRVKALRPVATSCIAYIQRNCCYNVAMPMRLDDYNRENC